MFRLRLSPRLLLLPLWCLHAARLGWNQRGRPWLTARVDARHALPPPEALRAAATAPIAGIHLHIVDLPATGWASLQAVRDALLAVRAAGHAVVIEIEQAGNAEMYLASASTRTVLRPHAHVNLLGVGAAMRFAGEALARLGLRFDVESAGAYKSFGEAFSRPFASAQNREAMRALVDDLQSQLEDALATRLGGPNARATIRQALADAPLHARDALARGLVDAVAYPDEVEAELDADGERRRVEVATWWKRRQATDRFTGQLEGAERVVVVHLEGNVVDGDGAPGRPSIAAGPVVEALDKLADDEHLRAVVLHVRSGGGSAAASDLIWRAVTRLATSKVVVAAFGDTAASGGYYLAAGAREIVAQPGTLTGSIGVVGGKLVVGAAAERLGVHTELLLGAPMAGYLSVNRPFQPEERARFRAQLKDTYTAFLEVVAAGRHTTAAALEPHAQGRVWTGARAREIGLVDHLGGVELAVERAAALAGLERVRRVDQQVGPRQGWAQRVLRRFVGSVVAQGAQAALFPDLSGHPWTEALGLDETTRALLEGDGQPLALSLEADRLARATR